MISNNVMESFNFFIPAEFEKAGEAKKAEDRYKNMIVQGVASTNDIDLDNQILEPSGFILDSFLSTGLINYDHQSKKTPKAFIGEPISAEVRENQFFVKGKLWEKSPLARDLYDTVDIMKASGSKRKLAWSIEGIPLMKDPTNPNRITKALISHVALTFAPKNGKTYAEIVKGHFKQEEPLDFDIPTGVDYLFKGVFGDTEYTLHKDFTISKARAGIYKDTPENRKLGRVGQRYGSKKEKEDKLSDVEFKGNDALMTWLKTQPDMKVAWKTCERGDWMLYIAKKLGVDDRKLTLTKYHIANQVRRKMKDERSIKALDAAYKYSIGEIDKEVLNDAADAAYAVVVDAAVNTIEYAAAYAAATAADVTAITTTAYAAAHADAYDDAAAVAADTGATARKSSLKKFADICRKFLTEDVMQAYEKRGRKKEGQIDTLVKAHSKGLISNDVFEKAMAATYEQGQQLVGKDTHGAALKKESLDSDLKILTVPIPIDVMNWIVDDWDQFQEDTKKILQKAFHGRKRK